MTGGRLPLLLLLVALPFACSDGRMRTPPLALSTGLTEAQVNEAQALWQAMGPLDYQVDVQQQCFCTPEAFQHASVVVRSGQVMSAAGTEPNSEDTFTIPLSAEEHQPWFTVEGQFALLQAELSNDRFVRAVFSPEDGHPTEFEVHVGPREFVTADGVVSYTSTLFGDAQ